MFLYGLNNNGYGKCLVKKIPPFFSLKIEPKFHETAVTATTSVTLSDRSRISLMHFS